MSAPQGDGHALRVHLESARRQTGVTPPQLIAPPCPPAASEIWSSFLELDRARSSNGWGPNPISYSELEAWARLTGRSLTPLDVRLYLELDRMVLQHYATSNKKK